jgi:hypothetical protein
MATKEGAMLFTKKRDLEAQEAGLMPIFWKGATAPLCTDGNHALGWGSYHMLDADTAIVEQTCANCGLMVKRRVHRTREDV